MVAVGQHLQAPDPDVLGLGKKIEPEHILQVCVTGSIVDRPYFVFLCVVPGLQPVEEPHKVVTLFLKVQSADLRDIQGKLF